MSAGTYSGTLTHTGFKAFLWTQFLGAFNDNVCKVVISMLAVALAASGQAGSGALAAVGVVFMLPFLLFSGYAGQIADRFNKRTVLIVTKSLEIGAMALAVFAFAWSRFDWMLAVLFLLGVQAAFFSPAKYGIVPEILSDRELSRANGLLEMSTFSAIILGTSLGSFLLAVWRDELALIGLVLTGIAIAGSVASLRIPRGAEPRTSERVAVNPWSGLGLGLRRLWQDRTLGLTVLGMSYFWFLGALLQMLILLLGEHVLQTNELWTGILGTFLAVGIGGGSLAAGRLSGDKVELGLVPLGSIGMGLFSILLGVFASNYWIACACLTLLGFSGGLFIVPLNALLQQKPAADEKGQLIATNNLLNTVGILAASGTVWLTGDVLHVPVARVILAFGLFTLVSNLYVLALLPDFLIRFTLWMLTHTVYRIRIVGQEHVPFRGPALLVCNHISHVDGFLVGACVQRFIRFMIYRPYYELPVFHPLLRMMKAIPVSAGNRQEIAASIERAREELRKGHIVCIFAEGAISRTGNMLPFKRGFERIVSGLDVPIVPVYLDRLWGSIFSFKQGRFFWKRPERLPYPVTVSFGAPLPSSATASDARQAIQALGAEAMGLRFTDRDLLHLRFVRSARAHWRRFCIADSTGRELTYGQTLTGALLLSRWVRAHGGAPRMMGLMLPASVGAALANLGITLAGKVPVNLNFTAGRESLQAAVTQCGIETILTSRAFLAKAKLDEQPGMRFLEDILPGFSTFQKVRTMIAARVLPMPLLRRVYAPEGTRLDDVVTVIFSSGSTASPKGVMLSHRNILANVEGMAQVYWVTPEDRILGVLPFFHSFGFTGTVWLPMVVGFGAVYHPNPMDAQVVGELVAKYRITLLIATPTFCAAYARKVPKEQFASLRVAIVGAEKLREPLAREFREKYGFDLLEGYGCTEMAPVVSVNVPDVPDEAQRGMKAGTVGHPLPGIVARVVDPESGAPLPTGEPGLLLVKGANRMLGYLDRPDLDREAMRDGWYVTGDIAAIDEDGFITITDRLSRFSKIGGEMVPHLKVEAVISRLLDDQNCIVSSVPDEAKGERLVAFYTRKDVSPQELWSRLTESELPRLWTPKRENLHHIDAIPLLGTGKVNLREIKAMALAKAATAESAAADEPRGAHDVQKHDVQKAGA